MDRCIDGERQTLNPANPEAETINPRAEALNPEAETLNPRAETLNIRFTLQTLKLKS
jgi:hypothetical protein